MKCKYFNGVCNNGKNEFDELCSIECCYRSRFFIILYFGFRSYLKFKKYIKKVNKL